MESPHGTWREDRTLTKNPIELVIFKDEEGARFSFGMIGSRAFAGTLTAYDLERLDSQGTSIRQSMQAYGLDPERIDTASRAPQTVPPYLEIHVEQGKVLESRNLTVGIVQGISGLAWLKFSLIGEVGHAGATPMNLRRDPLAAAEIMQVIEAETREQRCSWQQILELAGQGKYNWPRN